MNTWISLSPNDLTHYLCAYQLEALRKSADADIPTNANIHTFPHDPLPPIIADVTGKIRAEIAAFPKNYLSPDSTLLPPSLKSAACFLVIEALQSRVPTLKLTPDQIRNADNARIDLHRIARGELPIPSPFTITPSPLSPISVVSSRKPQATIHTLQGL